MTETTRAWTLALPMLGAVLAACAAARAVPPTAATTPPPRPAVGTAVPAPKLVVLLIIDQLPAWAFAEKRPQLVAGFDRLLRDGAWHTGQHPSAATITASGHALLGTGEPPATSGILANEWYHRELDRTLTSTEDLDGSATRRWLRVPALGDAVAAANTGAKAVSVSLKERSALLTLGRAGTPIWFDRKSASWTSPTAPGWLAAHNRTRPIAARLDAVWTPLDPTRLATLTTSTDDQPGEVGQKGFGPTFPHALRATKDPVIALLTAPLGNEIVLETAVAAIAGEQLGADTTADLLVVSLSAYDYVGHGWGHESWECWDMTLRLDQQIATFLAALDTTVGAGEWAMIVTSDHGASPLPERAGGGRIMYEEIAEIANRAAIRELGPGAWIAAAAYPTVYLTAAARAQPAAAITKAITNIVGALRAVPGLARVERTADLAGRCETRTGDANAICLALDTERSGEIVYLPAHGWILQERADRYATAHGSLHAYDREVPVILLAPGRRTHAPLGAPSKTPFPMTQIASLVARWLGVPPPSTLPRLAP